MESIPGLSLSNDYVLETSPVHLSIACSYLSHDSDGVVGDSQLGSSSERLRARLHIEQVKSRARSLVINKVGNELPHVTRGALDGGSN